MKGFHFVEELKIANGTLKAELILKGADLLNVFTGEISRTDLTINKGRIIGYGEQDAHRVIDMSGKTLVPGLIDVHFHIESTLLSPGELAAIIVPRGTTTIVADPHEIANVMGAKGIEWILSASEGMPLDLRFWLPSCVPSSHLDTSGAKLGASDLIDLTRHERICGLGEMMNVPGVVNADPDMIEKLMLAYQFYYPIDGHAPGINGKQLDAYIYASIDADHECTTLEEAKSKLSRGMRILIREGSAARNLKSLLPLVNEKTWPFISFVLDDRNACDLINRGGLDDMIRTSITEGLDPVTAVRLATITPAWRMGWKTRGHLGIGAVADIVVLDDLESFKVSEVWSYGRRVARGKKLLSRLTHTPAFPNTMNVYPPNEERFQIPDKEKDVRIIEIVKGEIITKCITGRPRMRHGNLHADPQNDMAKLAVVERHKNSGRIGLGFVKGLGLKHGAIASSVAHDSHNLIIAGMDDKSMALAAETIINSGGGLAVVDQNEVIALLELPIAGLMSNRPWKQVVDLHNYLTEKVKELGARNDPFMILSFLALPVIPSLKLTDKGLVDVNKFDHVSLYT